jgi:hypothetical protein
VDDHDDSDDDTWGTWGAVKKEHEEEHGSLIASLLQDYGGHNSASSSGDVEAQHR